MANDGDDEEEARARAVLAEMQDRVARGAHAALGIPTHATATDIRTAFLQLTKIYHPARFARMAVEIQRLANEVFLSLRAAHDSLAKPPQRTRARATAPVVFPNNHTVPPRSRPGPTAALRTPIQTPAPTNTPPTPNEPGRPPARFTPSPAPPAAVQPSRPGSTPTLGPNHARAIGSAAGIAAPAAVGSAAVRRNTPPSGIRNSSPTATGAPRSKVPTVERELIPIYELIQQRQWEPARAAIAALVGRSPTAPKYQALLCYTRGREAQLERRIDEARVELDSALQLDPDLQLAKNALAELFTRRR